MAMITRVEVDKRYQDVAKLDLGYIWVKCDFVLKYMKGPNMIIEPTEKKIRSYQAAFYILVHLDEKAAKYLWYYKPEVTFSVPTLLNREAGAVAVPHLISKYVKIEERNDENENYGENRRHSPSWRSRIVLKNPAGGYRRRPDLIIVKDESRRWPGRTIKAEDSIYELAYKDNLKRLVEMKFPKDSLNQDQEEDYKYISGFKRFSTLWITQDNKRENHENTYEFSQDLVPVFGKENLPKKYKLEPWIYNSLNPINLLSEELIQEEEISQYFRPETLKELESIAPWLIKEGEFKAENGQYSFIPHDGSPALTYTTQELSQAWGEIQKEVDLVEQSTNAMQQDESRNNPEITPVPSINNETEEVTQLPPIVQDAQATVGMSTGDKIILGLEIASTVALLIPGVNIGAGALRAGLFLFRIAKSARFAPAIARGLQSVF
ncbi:VRR-NUC domain-containing protein [Acinetobacter gerneri]|jgi:hypothetical protein|uniref:VRR-NUC domain-containing protein n=1 Tax=Acinetobacter gerneri TaxID=202952 RepID=UPI0023F517FA|nr:VRR-NUC domain-containing protein [Acinetobacter gerneri]MCH4242923.1 VRR-NUC domain-containing protein [Acinetobacter gerneri]